MMGGLSNFINGCQLPVNTCNYLLFRYGVKKGKQTLQSLCISSESEMIAFGFPYFQYTESKQVSFSLVVIRVSLLNIGRKHFIKE